MEPISTLLGHTGMEYDTPKNEPIFDPLAVRFITEIHEIRKTLNSVEPFSLRHKYDNGSFEPLSYFVESDRRS